MNKARLAGATLAVLILLCGAAAANEIHDAAKAGDLAKVQALIAADPASVNSRDENERTPLHSAVGAGHLEVAEFLLQHGADVNAVDYSKSSPLHLAANSGSADVVALLVRNGANLEARNMQERTPLHLACVWGRNLECCRFLIESGAEINVTDRSGSPLIQDAIFMNNREIVDLLLDSGADFPQEERGLMQALYFSVTTGMERPFNSIKEKCEQSGLPWWEAVSLHTAAAGGSVEIAKMLVEKGADVSAENRYGLLPIHVAAESGNADFIDYLKAEGADIDARSKVGKTALHYAADAGREELVARLIDMGASQSPPQFPALTGDYLGQNPPSASPEIFAIGIVSQYGSQAEHSPAVFSPDGNEVFWTKKFRGPILYMRRIDSTWTAPAEAPFNSEYGEGEPFFSQDGNRIYFLSFRPLGAEHIEGDENLWFVSREGDGWSAPEPVSDAINDFPLHWEVSVSANGTLYFATEHGDGYGKKDLYCARLVDGEYETPRNLGNVINSGEIEHTPFIAPDESYIIFASEGHEPKAGSLDLYISYRGKDGEWQKPIHLGDKINSPAPDLWPAITPDGKYMFYLQGEIVWVDADFISKLRE